MINDNELNKIELEAGPFLDRIKSLNEVHINDAYFNNMIPRVHSRIAMRSSRFKFLTVSAYAISFTITLFLVLPMLSTFNKIEQSTMTESLQETVMSSGLNIVDEAIYVNRSDKNIEIDFPDDWEDAIKEYYANEINQSPSYFVYQDLSSEEIEAVYQRLEK
ncbi:MAG: hypothetical protein M0P71_12785 [Melioribacteraceae bacterium]|nr:hypothetical protein [Melioribacteraceae bacterium]